MEFQTLKTDIMQTRMAQVGASAADFNLAEGDILVAIERFAFTANNVTYGAVGDQIGYWSFFPATKTADDKGEWGLVPVWGFAEVTVSRHENIAVGERIYGYFPMANFLKITPGKISQERLVDMAKHRAELPPVYNNYMRVSAETGYDRATDNLRALLMPLYMTSFCLCDALEEKNFHGADQVVIVSASSKTSIGLAYGLSRDKTAPKRKIVGLTSAGNVDFVQNLGLYDEVIAYDALEKLNSNIPTVMVDMAGNRAVLGQVHGALGDNLRWCHSVGLTHWDADVDASDPMAAQMNRERSAMFFAPGHIQRRMGEWGIELYNQKTADFMAGGMVQAQSWMKVREIDGLAAFTDDYVKMARGKVNPVEGLIVKV